MFAPLNDFQANAEQIERKPPPTTAKCVQPSPRGGAVVKRFTTWGYSFPFFQELLIETSSQKTPVWAIIGSPRFCYVNAYHVVC